jgi:cobalt-precorrin 5A hydrolase
MVGDETMSAAVAIGVGCRRGCEAHLIEALIRQALERVPSGVVPADVAPLSGASIGLFTIADKCDEVGLAEAAHRLGLALVLLPRAALRDQTPFVQTYSPHSRCRFDVPSVAEAAALAGAGPGAVLIVPRIAQDGATCAIAESAEGAA